MKLKQFQNYLAEQKIDLTCLIHPDSNITYFTQVKSSKAILSISPDKAKFYLSNLDSQPQIKPIQTEKLSKDWLDKINTKNIKKIGINKEALPLSYYEKLQKIFPQAEFIDLSAKLKQLRSLKTHEEIRRIKQACNLTVNAFDALVEEFSFKKFKTERDVASFLERHIYVHGAEPAFPTIAATGKNSAVPHHKTSLTPLTRGFLLLDFGACYKNYCADMTRMFYLGKISEKERKIYAFLLEVQSETIKQIKGNSSFFALEKFARKSLGKYSSRFIHSLGHGIGIDVHEQPSFKPKDKQKVRQNNVFTIEPGIYFPGKYGLRIEDTVLFGNKVKVLTKASKELMEIKTENYL